MLINSKLKIKNYTEHDWDTVSNVRKNGNINKYVVLKQFSKSDLKILIFLILMGKL